MKAFSVFLQDRNLGQTHSLLTQDAEPAHVHVGPELPGCWPFNCGQGPARKLVQILRGVECSEMAGGWLRPGLEQRRATPPAERPEPTERLHASAGSKLC